MYTQETAFQQLEADYKQFVEWPLSQSAQRFRRLFESMTAGTPRRQRQSRPGKMKNSCEYKTPTIPYLTPAPETQSGQRAPTGPQATPTSHSSDDDPASYRIRMAASENRYRKGNGQHAGTPGIASGSHWLANREVGREAYGVFFGARQSGRRKAAGPAGKRSDD